MNRRSIEIRLLEGLEDHLRATLPLNAEQRTVRPSPALETLVGEIATAWVREQLVPTDHVGFAIYKWPDNGPAHFGLLWAYNPRTTETLTLAFSETGAESSEVMSWDDAEMQLNMFALSQFGRPKLV